MNKTEKIIWTTFVFLSLLSIINYFLSYSNKGLEYLLLAFLTNFILSFILSEFYTFLVHKNFNISAVIFTYFCIILITFLYVGGILSYLGTKNFWTFSGMIFSWEITSWTIRVSFIIGIFLIFGLGFWIVSKDKLIQRKPRIKRIVIAILFFILFLIFIPNLYLLHISPITDLFYPLVQEKDYLPINPENILNNNSCTPILSSFYASKKFNVVIFMLESVSSEHMGYNGYSKEVTPNIDNLEKESINFKNAFSTASHSDFAQTAFLSSRYPLVNSIREINLYDNFPASFFWDSFKSEEYKTAYFTSQNDEWLNIIDYYNKTNLDIYSHSMSDGVYDYGTGKELKDYDETTTSKAIEWLNNSKNSSFFIYLGFQANHYPYNYPANNSFFYPDEPSMLTNYFMILQKDWNASINRYDNALRYSDENIGRVLEFLKENNLYNNTLIILTSDHGEDLNGSHGYLRHGSGIYNPEIHIPLLFKIPKTNHLEINTSVKHLDIAPTILKILNFSTQEKFQGSEMCKENNIFFLSQTAIERIGLVKGDIKYIINLQTYESEAYNLTEDPKETNNLLLSNNSNYYKSIYNPILLDWYNCQIAYYKKANYTEKINCG